MATARSTHQSNADQSFTYSSVSGATSSARPGSKRHQGAVLPQFSSASGATESAIPLSTLEDQAPYRNQILHFPDVRREIEGRKVIQRGAIELLDETQQQELLRSLPADNPDVCAAHYADAKDRELAIAHRRFALFALGSIAGRGNQRAEEELAALLVSVEVPLLEAALMAIERAGPERFSAQVSALLRRNDIPAWLRSLYQDLLG